MKDLPLVPDGLPLGFDLVEGIRFATLAHAKKIKTAL
jgi:hypothetical protein